MQTGYYSATGGLVTQFNRLNVISNNLANINTNGYKSDDVIIGDFERLFKESRDILPKDDNTKEAAKFINRDLNKIPQVVREYTNFALGDMKQTGNTLDFALKNKSIIRFSIKNPDKIEKILVVDNDISMIDVGEGIIAIVYSNLNIDIYSNMNNFSKR